MAALSFVIDLNFNLENSHVWVDVVLVGVDAVDG